MLLVVFAGVEEVYLLPRLRFLAGQHPEERHQAASHPLGGEHREDAGLHPLWDTGRHPLWYRTRTENTWVKYHFSYHMCCWWPVLLLFTHPKFRKCLPMRRGVKRCVSLRAILKESSDWCVNRIFLEKDFSFIQCERWVWGKKNNCALRYLALVLENADSAIWWKSFRKGFNHPGCETCSVVKSRLLEMGYKSPGVFSDGYKAPIFSTELSSWRLKVTGFVLGTGCLGMFILGCFFFYSLVHESSSNTM